MGKDLNGKKLPDGIFQQKNEIYKGSVMYHGITKQVYSKSLAECKRKLELAKYELAHEMCVEGSKMTVKAYADTFIAYKSKVVKKGTIESYTDILDKHILPAFGNYRLTDVRKDMLREWIYSFVGKKSPATIRLIWSVASALFSQAYCDNYIKLNPCDGIKMPKDRATKKAATFENSDQVATFLDNISATDDIIQKLCRFVMLTGIRSGEARALRWCDVDLRRKEIHIEHTLLDDGTLDTPKTDNSRRTVPLTDEAVSIVMALKSDLSLVSIVGDNFIFQKDGMPLTASYVSYRVGSVVKRCGNDFPNITIHSLRHYFATQCANAGMPPKVLMSIMGHSNIAITMELYAHKDDEINHTELDAVAACL